LIFDFVFIMSGKEQWAENVESFKFALKRLTRLTLLETTKSQN